ncbi:unnamed protein product [Sphagnum jensenii]|uniref:RING-type E3 ubiquitin transferase n=1 Tax=Sphagnum jensenii TaxID=128206 RepID=A0ABP1BXY9_9BRYO
MEDKASLKKKSAWSSYFTKFSKKGGGGREVGWPDVEIPEAFVCPISQSLMAEPVIVASGYTFERQCIQRWFQVGNRNCFKSGVALEHGSLTPNVQMQSAILGWCDKHKVARPLPPSAELAWQLVEVSAARAAAAAAVVPWDDSDPARPGFSGNGRLDPFDDDDDDNADRSRSGQRNGGRNGGIRPVEQDYDESSAASWRTRNQDAPLWKMRGQNTSSLPCSTSREFSREYSKNSDFGRSSGKESSLQSSSYNQFNSGEWPDSPMQSQYVHSASEHMLREETENSEARRHGIEPPLATTASSYNISQAGEYEASEGIEAELLYKLYHQNVAEQEEGAAEIWRLTRNLNPGLDYRATLCTPDVLKALVSLMQSQYPGIQTNALAAVMNLSIPNNNKIQIANAGAIPVLIKLLKSQSDLAQELITGALSNLALNDGNKMAIGVLGAVPPLLHVLRVGSQGAQRDAAMALYQLSFSQNNCVKLIKAGAVGILLHLMQVEASDLVSHALLILSNLAGIQEGRSAISEGNGISVLISLIAYDSLVDPIHQDGEDTSSRAQDWASVQEYAAAALVKLSNHNLRFRAQALQAGALEPLMILAEQGTQCARDNATLLLNILHTENKLSGVMNTPLYAPASHGHKAADSRRSG